MIHHLSFGVSDLDRSAGFYDAALAALGYVRVFADERAVGYGFPEGVARGEDKFCIKLRAGAAAPGAGTHLAFAAATREEVHAFHAAALAHGGRDNGEPGLRPHYGAGYYAAFVIDPDGHAIEAVLNES